MPVHQRHLEFVLEIADGAETADDERSTDLLREIDEKAVEFLYLNPFVVADVVADERHPLLEREQRTLGAVVGDGDDERVHKFVAAANEIFVAARERIE